MACNDSDRRQWRMQEAVVGAAASKTQAMRGGCWEPQSELVSEEKAARRAALRYFPTQNRSNTSLMTFSDAFSPVRSQKASSASSTQTDTASSPNPPLTASSAPATASRARDAVAGALDAVSGGFGLDAVSVCVDDALDAFCDLTGENASENVINEVFERFCVGK